MNVQPQTHLVNRIRTSEASADGASQFVYQVFYPVSKNTLSLLLDMPMFQVTGLWIEPGEKDDILHLNCEHRHAMAMCPGCQQISSKVHQIKERQVRDLSISGRSVYLHFGKRRFSCETCEKPFGEVIVGLRRNRRHTVRFEQEVYARAKAGTIKAAAQAFGLSESTVRDIFAYYVKKPGQHSWVRVLGIDEIALKKRHKQYALVLSDLDRRCVITVLPARDQATLKTWLTGLSAAEQAAIQVVSMDMWRPYRQFVQTHLPQAEIVADRFHVMKQLNDRLTKARRKIQRQADKTTRAILKGSRWLLVRNREDLDAKAEAKLQTVLAADPQLREIYLLKEEFRLIFERLNNRPRAERFLQAWLVRIEQSGNPYLLKFANTLSNWWQEILNYFVDRISNGFVEGLNRAIRGLIWQAYGFRNFENFRFHVLARHGSAQISHTLLR